MHRAYYADGVLLGMDWTPPYSFDWNTARTGAGPRTALVKAHTHGNRTGEAATLTVPIEPTSPGLFAVNQNGRGAPAGMAGLIGEDGSPRLQPLFDAPAGSQPPVPIDLGEEGDVLILLLHGTGIRGHQRELKATLGGLDVTAFTMPHRRIPA